MKTTNWCISKLFALLAKIMHLLEKMMIKWGSDWVEAMSAGSNIPLTFEYGGKIAWIYC